MQIIIQTMEDTSLRVDKDTRNALNLIKGNLENVGFRSVSHDDAIRILLSVFDSALEEGRPIVLKSLKDILGNLEASFNNYRR